MRSRPWYRVPALPLVAALLLSTPAARAGWAAPDPGASPRAAQELARGDSLYAGFSLAAALAAYAAALEAEPRNVEALCRAAQVESELGEDASGAEQARLVDAAVGHARAAVAAAPGSAQGHVWLAATLGRKALKQGPKKQLALAREIKAEIDRAMAIDSTIARAWHARAIWNRKLASLGGFQRLAANAMLGGVPKGASMENAVRDLERAIALEPGYVNHHLELGRTLAMLKRNGPARLELERAASLPPTSNPRDRKYQAEARELLAGLPKPGR